MSKKTKEQLQNELRIAKRDSELNSLCVYILLHPSLIEMTDWVGYNPKNKCLLKDKKVPHCGSVGCLAGLRAAMELEGGLTFESYNSIETEFPAISYYNSISLTERHSIPQFAAKLMHLTLEEADLLFFPEKWPEDFEGELNSFETNIQETWDEKTEEYIILVNRQRTRREQERYAKLVVKRVQHFIETGE